jgi:hypothetical protein
VFGQAHGSRASQKQHRAEVPLQIGNDPGNRRLRKPEVARRTRKVAELRHALEHAHSRQAVGHLEFT